MTTNSNGIEIKGLTKHYGQVTALDHVDLTLEPGKIYGLLGRNGAGKTTLLNILTGRIFASEGTATLNGMPISENDAALGQISMQSEQTLYPERMRVADAFKWAAVFYKDFDANYASSLAAQFGLSEKKRINSLSTGYCTIFKLIVSLSTGAPYIFLDEPVLGLDANHRDLFYRCLLQRYSEKPSCIVISTHLVEEVSGVIEDVIIIKEGKVLRCEPRETLLAQGFTVSGAASQIDAFIKGRDVLSVDVIGGLRTAYIMGQAPESVPEGIEMSSMDLQKLFVQLTN